MVGILAFTFFEEREWRTGELSVFCLSIVKCILLLYVLLSDLKQQTFCYAQDVVGQNVGENSTEMAPLCTTVTMVSSGEA